MDRDSTDRSSVSARAEISAPDLGVWVVVSSALLRRGNVVGPHVGREQVHDRGVHVPEPDVAVEVVLRVGGLDRLADVIASSTSRAASSKPA